MRHAGFMNTWWFRSTTITMLCLATVGNVRANSAVYERALRSTGWVIVPREKNTLAGTCWLADRAHKLVITSQHITDDCNQVLVYFPCRVKGEVVVDSGYYLREVAAINGRVIATDQQRDLALIQLESVPAGVEEVPLAAHSSRPGEDIHSIGNSGFTRGLTNGTLWRYTRGNVRLVYQRKIKTPQGIREVRLVETQSPVNCGDSGGPVVNDQGQLVGVTEAFNADQRLVSNNIDVLEVKSFLRAGVAALEKAVAAPVKAKAENQPAFSLVGAWKLTATDKDDKSFHGEGQFKSNGTFVLSPCSQDSKRKAQQGRYTYANDVLWLIAAEGHVALKLTWDHKDRFSSRSSATELRFERQESEEAVHSGP